MPEEPEVYTITQVATSMSQDQKFRQRAYLASMALRTACFLGAIVTHGYVRWSLVAGAVLLPYFAVVVANAGRDRSSDSRIDRPDDHKSVGF
ncbi:MAG: DUF3099 domain-containing protein [Actinobacteria bacterium]|uniref:Unannotated protein n=1 Tax=freshwater metagenome TaxID=449393 RepID=A0A6J5ZF10_9ZZZZ|nr:DUF3099 domain-containing protein [Actinomycetota bacterium]